MITIAFCADLPADAALVALPVPAGDTPEAALTGTLAELAPVAKAAAAAARFTGEPGTTLALHGAAAGTMRQVLLAGMGAGADVERAGSALVALLLTSGASALTIDLTGVDAAHRADMAARIAQAAVLRSWRFDAYRTRLKPAQRPTLETIEIVVGEVMADAADAWASLKAVADGVALTRTLVAEPPNIIYPESFVDRCQELAALGVEIEVLDEAAMRAAGMGALLGVSQGSRREARLLVLKWDGTGGTAEPTAFVGKGVTFDSGGISLKPPAGMEGMKWDMGGAGAVAGTMKALAGRKAKAHVIGVCGLVENMPDGNAQRPGDIVTSMSGQTIEVINTDAEGRLVLCDAIWWVQEKYKPKTIVDLATLTGAMVISLGHEQAGIFSNSDELAAALIASGGSVGEKLWRMPMGEAYDKLIDSPIADMKNVGPREGGSITAAQFIARYVQEGVRWAHLDIAGMAWAEKAGTMAEKGATGFGVRLLDRYVRDVLEG